jgi:anti-sigma regulatory factor (Ser/Thr protein kinase)
LTVSIVDDGIPFNPIGVETPDTEVSLEQRKIGGLGIHLVRKVMDKFFYQRRIDKNMITLVKYMDSDGS